MATYEFRCESCGKNFTLRRSISEYEEEKSPRCPKCGESDTRRLFSAFYAKTASKT